MSDRPSKPDSDAHGAGRPAHADVFAILESADSAVADPKLTQSLLDVARESRSTPFSAATVGVELVNAALCSYFPKRNNEAGAAGWRSLAASIAASIARDADSLARLERLWTLLCRRLDEQAAAK